LQTQPKAQLTIVGRRPTNVVQLLAGLANVSVFADVPDVRPYLEQAQVAVAPLRIARGIQNKVLEAMAMGKPVVASPGALAGIDLTPGSHALAADSPEQWKQALIRLWNSAESRETIGRQAREYVLEHHQWASTLLPWEGLIEAAVQQRRGSSGTCSQTSPEASCPSSLANH
jgi:glycosyltransferase involved in cell wall biosynthesis